jgi:hypothetical protein
MTMQHERMPMTKGAGKILAEAKRRNWLVVGMKNESLIVQSSMRVKIVAPGGRISNLRSPAVTESVRLNFGFIADC